MFWATFGGIARTTMAAALIEVPATAVTAAPAYADCEDAGQPPCTGPAPTADEVVAVLLAELTDPGIPAAAQSPDRSCSPTKAGIG